MMRIHKDASAIGSTVVLLTLIAGCTTSTDAVRVEQDYGNSVRHMIDAQIYDPTAAYNPSTEPAVGLDGGKAHNVLEQYRKDVAKPQKVEQPIHLRVVQ